MAQKKNKAKPQAAKKAAGSVKAKKNETVKMASSKKDPQATKLATKTNAKPSPKSNLASLAAAKLKKLGQALKPGKQNVKSTKLATVNKSTDVTLKASVLKNKKNESLENKANAKSAKSDKSISPRSLSERKENKKGGENKVQLVSRSALIPKESLISLNTGVCREVACEQSSTTGGYCRMHYIKNWKKIQRKQVILRENKLNHYIEELVAKYPDKYIEAVRLDLANEKDFSKVIADLEIDDSVDDFDAIETESAEGIIDSLKRDFDDDGDVF